MFQDLRYGARMLLKNKGFALVSVATLALGIGTNTALFSLLDVVMLKSLPVYQPERLVLFGKGETVGVIGGFPSASWDLFSYPFYQEVRRHNDVFSGVTAVLSIPWAVHGTVGTNSSSAELQPISVQMVSGTYFSVLGVSASAGRVLAEADDQNAGHHPVAVISHAWCQRLFGTAPAALGNTIRIDGTIYTIVGVAPADFFGTTVGEAPDIWVPLAMEMQMPPNHWNSRGDKAFYSHYLIARLRDGVNTEQASAEANLLFKQSLQDELGANPSPERLQDFEQARVELTPAGKGLSQLRRQFSLSLQVLMAAVGVVLLIACANVANLLLARAASRQKELAVRTALGAGRIRLVRQLLTESLLLATLGGAAGVLAAVWGSRLLVVLASSGSEPLPLDVGPNARVLGFALLASLLCAVVFGTAPALRASRIEPSFSISSSRGSIQSSLQRPFGKAIVVAQIALAVLLLVGAGLFVRTLINLHRLPTGFDQQNVTLFQVDATATQYKDAQLPALMHDVEEKVRTLPGVKAASFSFLTFNQGVWTTPVFIQGADQSADGGTSIRNNVVGSDYFAAMGIPLVLGRTFGSEDTEKSHKVAVISESMANRYFPNGSPLGKRFSIGGPSNDENEIIGVVKDVKGMRLTEEWRETAYYVYTQRPQPLANFVVRFSGSPQSGITQVRNAIQGVNRNIAIDEVVGLSDYIGRSLVNQKLVAQLSSFFGFLALILACVGIYGVFSYSVVRRTNEIGIRMALGAQQCDVLRLVLRESLTLVLIGTAVGLLASMLVSKLATQAVSDLTFGVEPNDPVTIGLASSLLVAVAVFAGYLPARRATRIDPIAALREE